MELAQRGGQSHSVQSTGSTNFTSSNILSTSGATYQFTFTTPGTYTPTARYTATS
ncbi:MAG TPA: hypothetical protein VFG66_05655 [Gemmatimonadales bacterium]|nr:hypothetical protein [Gemmatimonadales bacterium]